MVPRGKLGLARGAPRLRIEMQTEHQIRLELFVDEARAIPDFVHAIEQKFTLALDGRTTAGISGSVVIFARGRKAHRGENRARGGAEIGGTRVGGRAGSAAQMKDLGAEGFEERGEMLRNQKGHIAFG